VIQSKKRAIGFARKDGRQHGFQHWVGLAKRDKMTKPRDQNVPKNWLTLE
jgi:redox-sensitive bicupin YhaK (pirin superfamily)